VRRSIPAEAGTTNKNNIPYAALKITVNGYRHFYLYRRPDESGALCGLEAATGRKRFDLFLHGKRCSGPEAARLQKLMFHAASNICSIKMPIGRLAIPGKK